MTENKTFEDKFDHDPDAVFTEEEDIDLGPDDEFADARAKPANKTAVPERAAAGGGCLGGLFKVGLSLGLIVFCYFYIFRPEKFTVLQQKIIEIAARQTEGEVPPLSMGKPEETQKTDPFAVHRPPQVVPPIVLRGAGTLPDFSTAARDNAALNFYLIEADQLRFKTLDTYHDLLTRLIADWAGEKDPAKIERITGMPYKRFFEQTSVSLLSQTVLKQAGLTPTGTSRIIQQDPVQAMASVYPLLKEAMAVKKTVRDQLKTIEPVSSFLIHICRGGLDCLASWDLLIDMLGAGKYAQILEKTPEKIYLPSGN